jgi:hypothetical protein
MEEVVIGLTPCGHGSPSTRGCVINEFGKKGTVPLSERLSLSPEEASALTGIG